MPYVTWDAHRHGHLTWTDFATVDNLVMVLSSVRRMQLRYNTNRAEIAQILRDLPMHGGVVRYDIRFPDNMMVNMTNSVMADIYQRINSACDIIVNSDHGLDRREYDNTRQSLSSSVARGLELMSNNTERTAPHGIFARDTFERWYGLIWEEDEPERRENDPRPTVDPNKPGTSNQKQDE